MTLTPRVSLLSIVRQQIEITLCQVADVAARHGTGGAGNAALTPCVAQLHQVSGALRMVQFPGAARFCSEIESALRAALRGTPADKAEVEMAGRAAGKLREFVNDVAGGGAYQPPQLLAMYRELAHVGGNDAASEKDLFFPDAQDNAPAHANPRAITPAVLPALVKDLRTRYQRGLLGWLKESAKPDGLKQMRDVLDALHQIAAQLPEPRGLWWASVGLTEAIVELQSEPQAAEWAARVKPVFSRIDFLLRDLAAKGTADTAPAQRDVYYAIASCRQATPRLREAQQLLNLNGVILDAPSATGAVQTHQPLLDDTRARLENIKEVWTEYIAGEPKRLGRYRELLVPLTQKARELGNLPLLQLLLAVSGSTPQLPDPYPLDAQVMSLEMASALLMAENIIHHFNNLPSDLEEQVTIMKGWLAAAVEGKVATSTPAGLRADIVQKANDEKLRIATAREILKSLQQVEKAVEAYAGDATKRAALGPLSGVLRQVHGVFAVSNQKRAARLASACEHLLERCAGAPDAQTQRRIEWLAEGLGSLGFYLEPCLHGKEPAERAINIFFTRYENQPGFEVLLERAQPIPVIQPAAGHAPTPAAALASTVVPADAPAPAPAPAPAGADREMLEIFLEEASAVLTAMESSIAQARSHAGQGDQDALINVRRAFHTLKGSARMVGLSAFGDCAWELEQVMNHWLAQGLAATPALLELCADARELLAEWAHALQGETTPAIDASDIARRARALRGEAPEPAVATPAPHPAVDAEADLRNAVTLVAMPSGTAPQQPEGFMTMDTVAHGTAAAVAQTPTVDEEVTAQEFMTVMMPAPTPPAQLAAAAPAVATRASVPTYEHTLADLGDRLSWLSGLVEEIQEQASSSGAANTRLMEIAQMMGESMSEAIALQRVLREQLEAQQPK